MGGEKEKRLLHFEVHAMQLPTGVAGAGRGEGSGRKELGNILFFTLIDLKVIICIYLPLP